MKDIILESTPSQTTGYFFDYYIKRLIKEMDREHAQKMAGASPLWQVGCWEDKVSLHAFDKVKYGDSIRVNPDTMSNFLKEGI